MAQGAPAQGLRYLGVRLRALTVRFMARFQGEFACPEKF